MEQTTSIQTSAGSHRGQSDGCLTAFLEVLKGKRVSFVGPQCPSLDLFDLLFFLPDICRVFKRPTFN